ncbi:MAG: AraC family transcriptional regulator [Eubacteriales bacterium]|nr:AraC family transcriptional regulator [Eubacteriales bacterium]
MEIIEYVRKLDEVFPFEVFRVTIYKGEKSRHDQLHWHQYCEIAQVLSGRGHYIVNGNRFQVLTGDIVLFNNTEIHGWKPDSEEMTLLVMVFPMGTLAQPHATFDHVYLEPFMQSGSEFCNRIDRDEELASVMHEKIRQIETEYLEKKPAWIMIVKAEVAALLGLIYRCYLSRGAESEREKVRVSDKGKAVQRLEEVLLYINEHYAEKITLNQAAKIACMSPNYFSSYFKKIIGMGFSDYLISLRLERVEEMSRITSISTEQIAMACGFRNMSNFYRLQKKHALQKNGSQTELTEE